MVLQGQDRYQREGVSLTIHESVKDKDILIFTLKNTGPNTLSTDQFDASRVNRVVIFSPDGKKVSSDFISCHGLGDIYVKAGGQKQWEHDIGIKLNPYVTRIPLPKGEYEIYWIVNGVQSESFFYTKEYDGVRW